MIGGYQQDLKRYQQNLKKDGDSDRYKTILEFIKMGLNS
jgi:hypothetical protein